MPKVVKQGPKGQSQKSTAKKQDIVSRISSVTFGENDGIKLLLYGESGSGKTQIWSTFPGKILVIVVSGIKKSGELRSLNAEAKAKTDQVKLYSLAEIKPLMDHIRGKGNYYKTVVLDHVSGLQDLDLQEILGLEELPAQKSWGMASQQDYQQSTLHCKEVLRNLLNLDQNVVIIGQERDFNRNQDENTESEIVRGRIGVAVTPALAGWLYPTVDYVCQTFVRPKMITRQMQIKTAKGTTTKTITERGKGVEFCVRTEKHEVFTTKFRVPRGAILPDAIVDADYNKIMQVIKGDWKKLTSK